MQGEGVMYVFNYPSAVRIKIYNPLIFWVV